jgi:hypothetical protein
MQTTKKQPVGQPSDNDTDVNQRDHISSQVENENLAGSEEDDTSAVEEDGTPVLDEEDLEENNITDEDAENVNWDPPAKEGTKGGL